ncbi:MAG: hypothetical protein BWY06_02669 [Candidatus Latescibacteria bacterium ADurb.Bin168]|nr:MAG: hypothetical protein BWY06_02669 [Candidatus Latescibacteria bacterium ADurb.Bin168]
MRFAVTLTAAWVAKKDDVVVGREKVELMHEEPAILQMRAAVNFENGRVFPFRVEIGRFGDPTLYVVAIRAFEPYFLNAPPLDFLEKH